MVPSSLFHEQIVIVFHDGRHKAAQFFGNGVVARFEGRRPNLSVEPHLTASALFIDHDKALIVAIHKVRFIRKQSQFIQVRRTAPGAEGPAVAAFVAQGIEVENLPLQMARHFDGNVGPVGTDFRTDFTDAVAVETASVTALSRRRC